MSSIEEIQKFLKKAGIEDDKISRYSKALISIGFTLDSFGRFKPEELTKKFSAIITNSVDVKKIVLGIPKLRDASPLASPTLLDAKAHYKRLSITVTGPSSDDLKHEKSPRSPLRGANNTNRGSSPLSITIPVNKSSPRARSTNRPAEKRAVLIGINYGETSMKLRGCHNDVVMAKDMLMKLYQFTEDQIHILLDDGKATNPTRANILKELDWLVSDPAEDDIYFLHFSGHGTQVPNTSGKYLELGGGYEEALVPVDIEWDDKKGCWVNFISTNDFQVMFKHISDSGANFVSVFDCCHSGTAFRDLAADGLRQGDPDMRPRFLPPNGDNRSLAMPSRTFAADRSSNERELETSYPEYAILLAACRSNQTAADACINGKPCGAFSYYLYKLIKQTTGLLVYESLIKGARELLQSANFSQLPQLDALEHRRKWIFMTESATRSDNTRKMRFQAPVAPSMEECVKKTKLSSVVTKVDVSEFEYNSGRNWADIKVSGDVIAPNRDLEVRSKDQAELELIKDMVKTSIKRYRTSMPA